MTQNTVSFIKIVGILGLIFSGLIQIVVLQQNSHGILAILGAFVLISLMKTGEYNFAAWAVDYYKQQKFYLMTGCIIGIALFLSLSMIGSGMFWFTNHTKESAKLEQAKEFLSTKENDVKKAREQLALCKPSHVTKCVKPMSEIVAQRQAERDKAAEKVLKLSEVSGIDKAWQQMANFIGIEDENTANFEIFRDLFLSLLGDLISLVLIAKAESEAEEKRKAAVKPAKKDDDFNGGNTDYHYPVVSREPLRIGHSQSSPDQTAWQGWQGFEEQKKDVVNFIMDLPAGRSVALLGVSGDGKSSLLGHLAQAALKRGDQVYAIDTHFNISNSVFDNRCKIIGKGGNHGEVKQFILWIQNELKKRQHELSTIPNAERNWQRITVLMDEMFEVVNECGLTKEFAVMYTKMRKYKIVFLGISQAFNTKSMGVEGNKDLLKSFEIFQLSGAANDYVISHYGVDENKKWVLKNTFNHPGEISFSHVEPTREAATLNASQHVFHPAFEEILDKDAVQKTVILDAVSELGQPTADKNLQNQPGFTSYGQISQKVWGLGKRGTHYNQIIDDVLNAVSESESLNGLRA